MNAYCMYIEGWLKYITQFSTVCVTSIINKQLFSLNWHGSHFDSWALIYMEYRYIQPFVLKSVNSGHDHTNYNGTNTKIKYLYYGDKSSYIMKFWMNISPSSH